MTYTPIAKGTQDWDVPLNAALAQLDANISSSSGAALQAANNLSDLTNVTQARANLNLTGLANALSNMTATTDPTVSSDNTQGYSIGSTWFNTMTSALFIASNVSTGAAVWLQIPPTFVDLTSVQFIAGNKTFTGNTSLTNAGVSNPVAVVTSSSNGGVALRVINNQAADVALSARVTGDTLARLIVGADGKLSWSPGSGASPDVNLYRANSTTLQTDNNIQAANFPSGAWTSWTPTWTTSSGANTPSFGNATVNCSYTKFGRTVFFRVNITFGSTTNFGAAPTTSDNWWFSLPVAAANNGVIIGQWSGRPASSTSVMGSLSTTSSGTVMQLNIDTGSPNATAIANVGVVDSLSPFTWASGNSWSATGFYETSS